MLFIFVSILVHCQVFSFLSTGKMWSLLGCKFITSATKKLDWLIKNENRECHILAKISHKEKTSSLAEQPLGRHIHQHEAQRHQIILPASVELACDVATVSISSQKTLFFASCGHHLYKTKHSSWSKNHWLKNTQYHSSITRPKTWNPIIMVIQYYNKRSKTFS